MFFPINWMPKYQLQAKIDLQNLVSVSVIPDFVWRFKLLCTNCHEPHDSVIELQKQSLVESSHSRSSHNVVMKCKFCGKVGTIDMVGDGCVLNDVRDYQDLLQVEGRGWEIVDWDYKQVFVVNRMGLLLKESRETNLR